MSKKRLITIYLVPIIIVLAALACSSDNEATQVPVDDAPFEGMSASAANCDYEGEIKSIEALDELTVKFTLCFPDPAFVQKVTSPAIGILPTGYLEETEGADEIITKPVGTGPYKFERWDPGNEIVFKRHDDYWGDKAKEETLVFRWNSEASQRLNELRAGSIDGMDNVSPADFGTVESESDLALYVRPSINVAYVGMSAAFKPFDDPKVRRAVAFAIDRQRLVDNFYPPGSIIATQFLPPSLFGYTPNLEFFRYDRVQAEKLLDNAGVLRGDDGIRFTTTMSYRDVVRSYLPQPGIVAQDIQAQLKEVGIDVKLQVMESGAYLDAVFAGDQLPMHLLGGFVDYPDGSNLLSFLFSGTSLPVFGAKFKEISDAVDETNRRADPDDRLRFFREANIAIRDLAPVVPFAHGGSAAAYKASIEGAHVSPMAVFDQFAVMEDPDDDNIIWMQNAEPVGLYCALNTDGESLRACSQVHEGLLAFSVGGTEVVPALAHAFTVNEDSTEWTFELRPGVRFHDGSLLDANDVVLSYLVQWDVEHPFHPGPGRVPTFSAFFGRLLNAPAP
ncbi:MAG: peptide ABC transporter substrate-binding protein [Chloroflexi bacterium]|nr:peptide ABC transporter substrate-binding protein [Chloroflexota bacterium]